MNSDGGLAEIAAVEPYYAGIQPRPASIRPYFIAKLLVSTEFSHRQSDAKFNFISLGGSNNTDNVPILGGPHKYNTTAIPVHQFFL